MSVLIVEDEVVVAMSLKKTVRDLGYAVIGPAVTLDEAWTLARTSPADIALLDVNIQGESVLPLAERLIDTGHAIVFCSGYGTLPRTKGALEGAQTIGKPPTSLDLARALSKALRTSEQVSGKAEAEVVALAQTGA